MLPFHERKHAVLCDKIIVTQGPLAVFFFVFLSFQPMGRCSAVVVWPKYKMSKHQEIIMLSLASDVNILLGFPPAVHQLLLNDLWPSSEQFWSSFSFLSKSLKCPHSCHHTTPGFHSGLSAEMFWCLDVVAGRPLRELYNIYKSNQIKCGAL